MPVAYALIQREIETTYGVGIVAAPCCAITWAARNLAEAHGADVAREQLAALNRRRETLGAPWVYAMDCGL